MKKLALLLVILLFIVSCTAVHTESNVTCYNHHICVGDYYTYNSYKVYVVAIRTDQIRIRYSNNREEWVEPKFFEEHVIVVTSVHKDVHVYKDKEQKDNDHDGTQGMKKPKGNNGKHKGNPHY